jgi:hypothetical protein
LLLCCFWKKLVSSSDDWFSVNEKITNFSMHWGDIWCSCMTATIILLSAPPSLSTFPRFLSSTAEDVFLLLFSATLFLANFDCESRHIFDSAWSNEGNISAHWIIASVPLLPRFPVLPCTPNF